MDGGDVYRNFVPWHRRCWKSVFYYMEKGCDDLHGMYRDWVML